VKLQSDMRFTMNLEIDDNENDIAESSQHSNVGSKGKDSQKPWKSEVLPSLKEHWGGENKVVESKRQQSQAQFPSGNGTSFYSYVNSDNIPLEYHNSSVMDHKMTVGKFVLSQIREVDTVTNNDDPNYLKIIKRETRKIVDICETDIDFSERSYQITETHQEGFEPIIDIVTNMCFEEIERFHYDWNRFWCPEMEEQEIQNQAEKQNMNLHYNNHQPQNTIPESYETRVKNTFPDGRIEAKSKGRLTNKKSNKTERESSKSTKNVGESNVSNSLLPNNNPDANTTEEHSKGKDVEVSSQIISRITNAGKASLNLFQKFLEAAML